MASKDEDGPTSEQVVATQAEGSVTTAMVLILRDHYFSSASNDSRVWPSWPGITDRTEIF